MKNLEYIYIFANKHNFPQSDCEVMFKVFNGEEGKVYNVYEYDNDITSVKFDKSIVENEIKIEDIRFDIDSDLPEDVFFMWQENNPDISLKGWIALGEYIPGIIKNTEFLDEIDALTKEIEMKLSSVFGDVGVDDSDFEYDNDDDYEYEEDGEE